MVNFFDGISVPSGGLSIADADRRAQFVKAPRRAALGVNQQPIAIPNNDIGIAPRNTLASLRPQALDGANVGCKQRDADQNSDVNRCEDDRGGEDEYAGVRTRVSVCARKCSITSMICC